MSETKSELYAGDLFGEIYHAETAQVEPGAVRSLAQFVPGIVLAAIAALAAGFLSQSYDFPLMLMGLLIGLAASFMSENPRTAPGLDLVSRHALRLGIVLLGLQVTLAQVGELGLWVMIGLLIVMGLAFMAALLAARIFGQQTEAGILAGGATAICGASAALALYGVIGRDRLDQARFSVTLVGVALASAIAMAAYPLIAAMLGLSDAQAGFLIGASVHDAAQAIGGAYDFSTEAGQDATVVKLARVAMLAPVVALVALWIGRGQAGAGGALRRIALPWFLVAFLALVLLNSAISVPAAVMGTALAISKILLLLAVTATAIRSHLGDLVEAGWRPLMPVLFASIASFAASLLIAWILVP